MTSTNIFSGLKDDRNSSRVLRPPGGGQTDVLGLNSAPEEPPKRGNPKNVSSFTVQGGTPEKARPAPPVREEKVEAAKSPEASAPSRPRVPPGGFSSGGFW